MDEIEYEDITMRLPKAQIEKLKEAAATYKNTVGHTVSVALVLEGFPVR